MDGIISLWRQTMKKADIRIGGTYTAKVSGKLTTIRIASESPYGGWNAVNVQTGREVRIRTAARLRKPVGIAPTTSLADFWAQWHALKDRDPGSILIFRMGDDFQAFGEDAVKISAVLNITITPRVVGYAEIDTIGFPHAILEPSLAKLVAAGYHVAVCEQVTGPVPSSQIVERVII